MHDLSLDSTPTGEEEYRDFDDIELARGSTTFDEDKAKTRVDRIARRLAISWTILLVYIIFAQGIKTGVSVQICSLSVPIMPKFSLTPSEFIAVVTTTTASVFGFLVIVANHLFRRQV